MPFPSYFVLLLLHFLSFHCLYHIVLSFILANISLFFLFFPFCLSSSYKASIFVLPFSFSMLLFLLYFPLISFFPVLFLLLSNLTFFYAFFLHILSSFGLFVVFLVSSLLFFCNFLSFFLSRLPLTKLISFYHPSLVSHTFILAVFSFNFLLFPFLFLLLSKILTLFRLSLVTSLCFRILSILLAFAIPFFYSSFTFSLICLMCFLLLCVFNLFLRSSSFQLSLVTNQHSLAYPF